MTQRLAAANKEQILRPGLGDVQGVNVVTVGALQEIWGERRSLAC